MTPLRSSSVLRLLLLLPLLVLAARPAGAVDLAAGDILVADLLVGLVRVDPATGAQTVLPDPTMALDGPTGLAVADHPGFPGRPVVWVADSGPGPNLVVIDPVDGAVLGTCTNPGSVNDVEISSDGSAVYAAGGSLLRYEVSAGSGDAITCTGPTELSDLTTEAGAAGQTLGLIEDAGGVVQVVVGLGINGGLVLYDVGTDMVSPVAGTPTPAGTAVYGVHVAANGLAFTQIAPVLPNCAASSGVFAGVTSFSALSQGGLMRCPVGIAGDASGRLVVSDQAALSVAPNPRVVRLSFDNGMWVQAQVAEGTPMVAPFDIEVVPEPAGGAAAALAACAWLARRRRALS